MYVKYWRLKEQPFSDALDSRYFYPAPQHEEALARLVYTARQRKNGAVLTGAHGTGKSLLCRIFLQRLAQVGCFSVAQLENPLLSDQGLWQDLVQQLTGRLEPVQPAEASYQRVVALLTASRQQGGHGVLIVEEAQLLAETQRLERIRLLMNLRDEHGYPLLTVLLVGAEEILHHLEENESVRQRMNMVWRLTPLTRDQLRTYIDHRLRIAGGNAWIMADSAVDALQAYSKGIPRLVHQAADMALYLGMVESAVRVEADLVERVVADMQRGLDPTRSEEDG